MLSSRQIKNVIRLLEENYGTPRHGNPKDPLDDLIYLKLSQQTNHQKFQKIYSDLKNKFERWEELLNVSSKQLANVLKYGGLHKQRASQIKKMLSFIHKDKGNLDLKWLKKQNCEDAIEYLISLPGVGIKTAYSVAMYTLNCDILPVDTHVYRISERIGLIEQNSSMETAHKVLNEVIPKGRKYSYHVNCISHGRTVCATKNPKCFNCIVKKYCCKRGLDEHC
jgi:endonuclease III